MAAPIYDPTSTIRDISKSTSDFAGGIADKIVARAENKTANLRRVKDQIQAIPEAADPYHRELIQGMVTEALSTLKNEAITQKKANRGATVDMKGLAGMRSTVNKLANAVNNSQIAGQNYKDVSKMIMDDPYTVDKERSVDALTNTLVDPEALTMDPSEFRNRMSDIYRVGLDQNQMVLDGLKEKLDTFSTAQSGVEDPNTGDIISFSGKGFKGIHDAEGNVLPSAEKIIMQEAAMRGLDLDRIDPDLITKGFDTERKRSIDKRGEDVRLERAYRQSSIDKQNQGKTTKKQVQNRYNQFVDGAMNGKPSSMVNAIMADTAMDVKIMTAGEVQDEMLQSGNFRITPEFQATNPDTPVAISIGGKKYPMTEEGLKSAYMVGLNDALSQDNRLIAQDSPLNLDPSLANSLKNTELWGSRIKQDDPVWKYFDRESRRGSTKSTPKTETKSAQPEVGGLSDLPD